MLDELWQPFDNSGRVSPYFENEVITGLYNTSDHVDSDYYGVFSYKFNNKHHITGERINQIMQRDEYAHDVYSFFRTKQFKGRDKANTFQDRHHPYLLRIGELIVTSLFGKDINKIIADRIYYNHWIAKKDVFTGYCKDMLIPAIDLIENDPLIHALCWEDSNYNHSNNRQHIEVNRPMDNDKCMEVFGVPYYPHHPFVLERLPSIYFALKGYSIMHV